MMSYSSPVGGKFSQQDIPNYTAPNMPPGGMDPDAANRLLEGISYNNLPNSSSVSLPSSPPPPMVDKSPSAMQASQEYWNSPEVRRRIEAVSGPWRGRDFSFGMSPRGGRGGMGGGYERIISTLLGRLMGGMPSGTPRQTPQPMPMQGGPWMR